MATPSAKDARLRHKQTHQLESRITRIDRRPDPKPRHVICALSQARWYCRYCGCNCASQMFRSATVRSVGRANPSYKHRDKGDLHQLSSLAKIIVAITIAPTAQPPLDLTQLIPVKSGLTVKTTGLLPLRLIALPVTEARFEHR